MPTLCSSCAERKFLRDEIIPYKSLKTKKFLYIQSLLLGKFWGRGTVTSPAHHSGKFRKENENRQNLNKIGYSFVASFS